MNWIDAIYRDLDKKHASKLKEYGTSTEEIVKDMWLALRTRLAKDDAEDVMVNYFGTFHMKSEKLFTLIFLNLAVVEAELEEKEMNLGLIRNKVTAIKKYVGLYNDRIKYNKKDKRQITYNEKENKIYKGEELVTIKSYNQWVKNIKLKNGKRNTRRVDAGH